MSIYKRGEAWYCDITINGRRIREPLGTTDKALAQRYHDERKAALWQQDASAHRQTLTAAAKAWVEEGQRDKKDHYRLRRLIELLGDIPLDTIDAATLANALAGQSPGNHNRNRALLVAILNVAHLRGWLHELPHLPTRKVATSRIRFLTATEWRRLHDVLPPHLKPMATLAISTGLRRSNITHLEWSQVDLARRVLWIHPDQAKAGRAIGIPLSDEALAVLTQQRGKHERWCFPTHRGGPQVQISTGWKAALTRAGIEPEFRWHDLRHTWASWHVMSGTPLEVLQKLGGWASLTMVLRYAHLSPEHLAGFANNAKPYAEAA